MDAASGEMFDLHGERVLHQVLLCIRQKSLGGGYLAPPHSQRHVHITEILIEEGLKSREWSALLLLASKVTMLRAGTRRRQMFER